ncbi:2-C-methyl-D-erythritol 4-phosphate cytidylyltransferase [Kocuria rhizophila]|uniref:2-C-methyl-D-erythritol 4-phosphate cytidylyltransferase n=1 Tax=Kocuria rhizophila TaxID=72000 RepID=UPI001E0601B0|nr:2-C-methyl-D-erythritol 4-phosphate cytidylyltransferase [Kocuria rhizophila]MCC5672474.1 2-C-methyl-D-erythritol 4-phosphate cytidylyltransferase [Kocuria rhizophila]
MHHRTASPSAPDGLAVVVVAAGSGTRLGYGMPKALVPLSGRPLLEHALTTVREALPAASLLVTVPAGDTELTAVAAACGARAVTGGATRAQSVARALAALPSGVTRVLVHDAARCLTPPAVFARVVAALQDGAQAVVPVTEVTDTVRGVDPAGRSTGTVNRAALRAVQTPQGFGRALLERVNGAAGLLPDRGAEDPAGITDDASLVERYAPEHPVVLVAGDLESFKITRPLDLVLARAVVESRG